MSIKTLFLTSIGIVIVAVAWRLYPSRGQLSGAAVTAKTELSQSASTDIPPLSSTKTSELHSAQKGDKDYKQRMDRLLPLAIDGSVTAQYELARTLHYCNDILHLYFLKKNTDAVRTLEESQRMFEYKLPGNSQDKIADVYERCHAFFDNQSQLQTWNDWLEKSANAGYPPAMFMKADLMRQDNALKADPAITEKARNLAIDASSSGNPIAVFGMADFVSNKTQDQAAQLMSAWWLAGCERGYDCGSESEWIQATCTSDPQCANKPTVVEELQRTAGAKFGEVQQLAEKINAAIDSHDPEAIKKFL